MQASPPPIRTTPAPTRLFYDGSQIRIKRRSRVKNQEITLSSPGLHYLMWLYSMRRTLLA